MLEFLLNTVSKLVASFLTMPEPKPRIESSTHETILQVTRAMSNEIDGEQSGGFSESSGNDPSSDGGDIQYSEQNPDTPY